MSTKTDDKQMREYRRHMLRGEFRSLFWVVFSERKRSKKFTLQAFADKLGIGKSSLSRGFNEPQNWTIDKMADMADALGVELIVEARDVQSGAIYTPVGQGNYAETGTIIRRSDIMSTDGNSCSRTMVMGGAAGRVGVTNHILYANAA
jgi:transcriptional regulator with XRE-family HTH domain